MEPQTVERSATRSVLTGHFDGEFGRAADNHWIGFVREMREHPRDGAMVLIVHDQRFDHQTICVKVDEIRVVTRARVMLDVGFSLFERERDTRYRCPPEFLAA